jgi:hypothetical protein
MGRGTEMSIMDIQELLIHEGERRRQLGLLARRQVDDDWDLSFNPPRSSEDEPRAREVD